MIGGQVTGREGLVPEEAGPDCCSCQRCPQARRVRWQQFEALDEELPRFLGAHLGRFFDVWIHHLGKPYGVDRVLVGGVEFGQHAAQHCPDHIGRQPRDPVSLQEPPSQGGLADPGRAADEVENMVSHDVIVLARPGQRLLAAPAGSHQTTGPAPAYGHATCWRVTADERTVHRHAICGIVCLILDHLCTSERVPADK